MESVDRTRYAFPRRPKAVIQPALKSLRPPTIHREELCNRAAGYGDWTLLPTLPGRVLLWTGGERFRADGCRRPPERGRVWKRRIQHLSAT